LKQIDHDLSQVAETIDAIVAADKELRVRADIPMSIPGIAKGTACAILTDIPELGQMAGKQAAKLAGCAPISRQPQMRFLATIENGFKTAPDQYRYSADCFAIACRAMVDLRLSVSAGLHSKSPHAYCRKNSTSAVPYFRGEITKRYPLPGKSAPENHFSAPPATLRRAMRDVVHD
jgi:hypothetical protein